ncbi:hypothetical protein HOY80DRAFT_135151 [Tuber brumale]|nr:hypothetical protein HOY80DRAFT_135151 [Tuber brumale]
MAEKEIREKVCEGLQKKKTYTTRPDRKQLSKARLLTGKELLTLRKAHEELDSRPKRIRQRNKTTTTPITLPSTPHPELEAPAQPPPHISKNYSRCTTTLASKAIEPSDSESPVASSDVETTSNALWNSQQNKQPSRRRRRSSETPFTPTIARYHMPDRPLHMKLRHKR